MCIPFLNVPTEYYVRYIYIQNCLERDTILHFHVTYHIYTFLCESMEIFRSSSLSTSHRRLRRHFQKNILSYNIVCCIIDVCIIKNNYAMIFLYTSITLDFYIGILSRENCEFKLEFSSLGFLFFAVYILYILYMHYISKFICIYMTIFRHGIKSCSIYVQSGTYCYIRGILVAYII